MPSLIPALAWPHPGCPPPPSLAPPVPHHFEQDPVLHQPGKALAAWRASRAGVAQVQAQLADEPGVGVRVDLDLAGRAGGGGNHKIYVTTNPKTLKPNYQSTLET